MKKYKQELEEYVEKNWKNFLEKKEEKISILELDNDKIFYGKTYQNGFFEKNDEITLEDIEDVNFFAEQLQKYPKQVRGLIYIICERCQISRYINSDHITFDSYTLENIIKDPTVTERGLSQLKIRNNLYIEEEFEYTNKQVLRFQSRRGDYDILNAIAKYCKSKNIKLYDVIVNLRFDLLD